MKKILSFILILATILALVQPAFAAQLPRNDPQYTNAQSAYVTLSICNSGYASIMVTVNGIPTLKKINVVTYLEKKVGSSWVRVDISEPGNIWSHSVTSNMLRKPYAVQLDSSGEYRVVSKFTLTASTVEYITDSSYATY